MSTIESPSIALRRLSDFNDGGWTSPDKAFPPITVVLLMLNHDDIEHNCHSASLNDDNGPITAIHNTFMKGFSQHRVDQRKGLLVLVEYK